MFREYLRAGPDARAAYARLKQDLALRYRDDRLAYNAGETGFILDMMEEPAAGLSSRVGVRGPAEAADPVEEARSGSHAVNAVALSENSPMEAIEDVAERRFAWLVTQRGCTFVREHELETVIEVRGPRPDFYVRSPAGPFLAEVKAF